MRVIVAETDLRHRAVIGEADCCEAGHPEAIEAARHAWTLTRALTRREAVRARVAA